MVKHWSEQSGWWSCFFHHGWVCVSLLMATAAVADAWAAQPSAPRDEKAWHEEVAGLIDQVFRPLRVHAEVYWYPDRVEATALLIVALASGPCLILWPHNIPEITYVKICDRAAGALHVLGSPQPRLLDEATMPNTDLLPWIIKHLPRPEPDKN